MILINWERFLRNGDNEGPKIWQEITGDIEGYIKFK